MNKRPIEIIAEVGINWNGSVKTAENLIDIAVEAGADVVKFQLYDPRKRPDIDSHPHREVLLKSRISKRLLYHLKEYCDKANTEFMCSVFDVDKVDWLEAVGVKRYKIGSKSFYDEELVRAVLATKKPVLLSWGYFDGNKGTPIYFLDYSNRTDVYCISKYPAEFSDLLDFRTDFNYGGLFSTDFKGYSSHVEGITDAVVAMSRGARIIEKHVTLDKREEGPDHCFSLEPQDLKQLCQMRDEIEQILYL